MTFKSSLMQQLEGLNYLIDRSHLFDQCSTLFAEAVKSLPEVRKFDIYDKALQAYFDSLTFICYTL